MLSFIKQKTRIANFNPRAEKHGPDNVLAGDIKLETQVHSSALDQFDTVLRTLLYRKAAVGEQVPQSELALDTTDDLIALRVPHLAPLRWDEDYPGYELGIESGSGLLEPLQLSGVELSNFVFEALEGGSVAVTCRATCHPDTRASGALCGLIGKDVFITLTPPDTGTAELFEDDVLPASQTGLTTADAAADAIAQDQAA